MQSEHPTTNNDTLNQALNKVMQEQQEQKAWISSCQKLVREQQEKIAALEQQVKELKGKPTALDSVSLEGLRNGVEDLKKILQAQPKNIEQRFIHERNVFPPSWKAGDFKTVFDTVLKGVVILIVVIWAIRYINAH